MEEIVEIINKKFITEKQKIKKITILLDVYDEKTELVHGILITLPSQNNSFLELLKQV